MYKFVTIFFILISFGVKAQKPELKGGLDAFIKNNIVYPSYSLHNCIQGVINIGFKLNAKGEVYYAAVNKGLGVDLDEEALRLVRMSSKKWIVPSSHDTTSLLVVPVNFALSGYDCDQVSKADIALAIKAYKDQEALTNVVTNFYKNKELGTYKAEDEVTVQQIKTQLNIDDDYLDGVVKTGLKKIEQGDIQGACKDFIFVKYMGSNKANDLLLQYCK